MVEKITKWKIKIISLYKSNYLATFHTRDMAKKLKTSHVTLLPHLKDLENNKILKSKIIGKNKVYSLNLNNISVKDQIIISEKFETLEFLEKIFFIKKISNEISKLDLSGSIILFGSYIKNYYTKISDIDIFYLGNITKKQIKIIEKIGEPYNKKISIKKSSIKNFEEGLRKRDTLIKEIVKDHVILQNPDIFINILWKYYNEIK
jgi:predicted nucleotidyltransferase